MLQSYIIIIIIIIIIINRGEYKILCEQGGNEKINIRRLRNDQQAPHQDVEQNRKFNNFKLGRERAVRNTKGVSRSIGTAGCAPLQA